MLENFSIELNNKYHPKGTNGRDRQAGSDGFESPDGDEKNSESEKERNGESEIIVCKQTKTVLGKN